MAVTQGTTEAGAAIIGKLEPLQADREALGTKGRVTYKGAYKPRKTQLISRMLNSLEDVAIHTK